MKRTIFWIILIVIAGVFLQVTSLAGLYFLKESRGIEYKPVRAKTISSKHRAIIRQIINGKTGRMIHDPLLGWSPRKNFSSLAETINAQGLRANRNYSLKPLGGKIRIAAFGDSFTYCPGVRNQHAWPAVLEQLIEGTEVLNFGVEGYGLDQALLRYQNEGVSFSPQVVLIGFMSENIFRHVNIYRPFYSPATSIPLAKPRFVIKENRLALVDNPIKTRAQLKLFLAQPQEVLPKIGAYDYYYQRKYKKGFLDFLAFVRLLKIASWEWRESKDGILVNHRYNTRSEAFQITTRLFDQFIALTIANKAVPVILIFPNKEDIVRARTGKPKAYQPLLDDFDKKGYRYIDVMNVFEQYASKVPMDHLIDYHYSPLANRLIASYLLRYFQGGYTAE